MGRKHSSRLSGWMKHNRFTCLTIDSSLVMEDGEMLEMEIFTDTCSIE